MSNVQKMVKKIVTVGVAVSTMLWSVGVTLMPVVAQAASCPDNVTGGTLIKVNDVKKPAIYALNANMQYQYFTTGGDFKTWNPDESYSKYYVAVSQACFDSLSQVAQGPYSVFQRAGSGIYKYLSSDQLYVMEPSGVLAKITPEAAKGLYGNYTVTTIGLSEWPYYKTNGTPVTEVKAHPGMLVSNGGKTWYVNTDNTLSEVTATGFTANRFKTTFVRALPASAVAGMNIGTTIDAYNAAISDRLMGGSVGSGNGNQNATGGALTVSLAADNPAGGTLASGTAYNKMLKVNLMAASKPVKVSAVTVTRTGLIANTSVTGISIWDSQGRRHGDVMTSFNSDNQVTIGFGSDPILVAAGSSDSLTVAFNISSSITSGTVGASLNAQASVQSDASSVAGSFPISGNAMSIVDGSASLANYSLTAQGVGGNAASDSAANVSIGDVKEIGKFKFSQDNGKNDIRVEQVTFYLEGTVKEQDFTNFVVVAPDNTQLGAAVVSANRYVTVKFDQPLTVPKGTNRVITLKATVSNGSGNYIRVHVQNDYDVVVRDAALGYGILPTTFTDQKASDGYFKVKSGTLNVVKAPDSLSGNISSGATDVVLGKFNVTAVGEDMEVRKLGIQVASSGPRIALTGNVRVMVDGVTVLTISGDNAALPQSGGTQQNLSQYFTIKAGQTKAVSVVANVSTNATSTVYTASIGNMYAKRLSTLDFADNLPSSSLTAANGLTVQSTNLSVVKDTTLGNSNVSPASTVTLGRFIVRAGSAEDIRVTNLVIANNGSAGLPDAVQNLELWANGLQLGSTISIPATSSNSYSFSLDVPKNTSVAITVKGYVTSIASSGSTIIPGVSSTTYIGKSTNNTTVDTTNTVLGQTFTVQNANVNITAVSDATTVAAVRLPSGDSAVQVGKWKFEAQNSDVAFDKLSFYLMHSGSFVTDTTSSNFGTVYLYDASDMVNPLATGEYVPGTGNGYVRFEKSSLVTVLANQSKYLVLKAKINGSGTITPASVNAWIIPANTGTTDVTARDASGSTLSATQLDLGANGNNDTNVTSTWYLFHTAAPKVSSVSLGSSLSINSQAPVFKFKIDNPGDREIRISTTTVVVSASGLAAAGSTGTGTIYGFQLWEANEAGGIGTQLATNTMVTGGLGCLAGSSAGPMTVTNGSSVETCAQASTSSLTVTFGPGNDNNSLLDSLTITPGGSRTFVVVANTTAALTGKTTGSVSLSAMLDGATGFSAADATNEVDWANGVITYFYTPVGGSENSTAYSASDSYDVVGDTLTRSV